jgi:hypothetical protein
LTLVQDLGIKPSRRTRTERTLSRLREFSSTVTLWTFCVGAKLSFPFECNVHSGRGSSTSMKRHHFNALQNVVLLVISLAPMSKHINNNTDTTRSYKFTKDATRTLNTCMSFGAKLQMLESANVERRTSVYMSRVGVRARTIPGPVCSETSKLSTAT